MRRGYFDESGTHADAGRTAGYVGDPEMWLAVAARWRELLSTHRITAFHRVDALSERGAFAQMEYALVDDLCRGLAAA